MHPSGYYSWLAEPQSARAKEDQHLLGLIKHAWLESGGVYGYRKIHDDLRELGGESGGNRVGRLMQMEGLRSQTGYRRRTGFYGGKPTVASPDHLARHWQSFLKANDVISSMSRRGNCHDNAVTESFFQLLKRERIRRKIYTTREDARSDIFD